MSRILITDVDDAALAFEPAFTAWAHEGGLAPRRRTLRDIGSIPVFLDCSREHADKVLGEFAEDPHDRFCRLEPLPGAPEAFKRFERAGWRFVAISSCITAGGMQRRRRRNLEDALGVSFDAVHCVGLGADKGAILDAYPRGSVWVEDTLRHARAGAALGLDTYIMHHEGNRGGGDFTRVGSWTEIADRLLGEERIFTMAWDSPELRAAPRRLKPLVLSRGAPGRRVPPLPGESEPDRALRAAVMGGVRGI